MESDFFYFFSKNSMLLYFFFWKCLLSPFLFSEATQYRMIFLLFFLDLSIIKRSFISWLALMIANTPEPKLGLQYASNNDFFAEGMDFLQKISFVSMLSVDMYVKYSFQKVNRSNIIQGAEIDTYDNDHMVNDTFFVHKIKLPEETFLTHALVYIQLNHNKAMTLKEIASISRSIPMVSLFIFTILFFLIPGVIGRILQGISLIAILIFILFFAYKFLNYFYQTSRNKTTDLQAHKVTYLNPRDLSLFTPQVKQKIEQLQLVGVTDIAVDRNMLYLKQDLLDIQDTTLIWELFGSRKMVDENQKKRIMDQMIDLLSDQNFLDLFIEQKNAD